jgi:CheY-like chemotaxis protein
VAESRNHLGGGCVLVAEDDEDLRSVVCLALAEQGYTAIEARNGREALSIIFGKDPPDVHLIISDLDMPEMSGADFLRVISNYSRTLRIPVILVSGAASAKIVASSVNVVGRLEKPFGVETLLRLIAASLTTERP